ncbi:hypothetical protein TNCV_4755921 [Trichonephila clavipes]|nr:hypothetical protein TNCV_4755921 [Trichonephila clavipes]
MSRRNGERAGTTKERLYPLHKGHATQVTTSKARQGRLKSPGSPALEIKAKALICVTVLSRRVSPSQIHFGSVEGLNFKIALDRETRVREITTSTNLLISGFVPTHMQRNPLETHVFPLTKSSQFEYNIYTSIIHNFWPIPQILNGASAVCQDSDTVLIQVESTTNSYEFWSKGGK